MKRKENRSRNSYKDKIKGSEFGKRRKANDRKWKKEILKLEREYIEMKLDQLEIEKF